MDVVFGQSLCIAPASPRNELILSSRASIGPPGWLRQYSVCLQCGRPGFAPWGNCHSRNTTPSLASGAYTFSPIRLYISVYLGSQEYHHIRNLVSTYRSGEGQGSLACCSPWGCKELDTTEQLNITLTLGNSNIGDLQTTL